MRFAALFASALSLTALPLFGQSSPNFCNVTTDKAVRSCQAGALNDLFVAQGKCANLASTTKRASCRSQADAAYKDALTTCDEERAVRQSACRKLGPAPYDPVIDPANFTDVVDNPFFPLKPGTTFIYEGKTADELEHIEFIVTHKTRRIAGVRTVVVQDMVFTNGALTENTFDYFAQDREGNVWYFGEDTEELVNGFPTTIDGTFHAGVEGAKPGIIMEAHPMIGDFYRQEFDLRNAEDFAQVTGLDDTITVPAGKFTHCLRTLETTPLEPTLHENKWYALGVGNIQTRDKDTGKTVRLIRIENRS